MEHVIDEENWSKEMLEETDLVWVFETYHKQIYRYLFYRVGQSEVAEDLTSQVFEKVIIHRTSYRGNRAPLKAWLFTIARNVLNDYLRKQKKHIWAPLESLLNVKSEEKSPEEVALIDEDNKELIRAVGTLNERERNIIALKFGAELSHKEIADLVNLSESNVGSILYRSMKKLKREMERGNVVCLKRA